MATRLDERKWTASELIGAKIKVSCISVNNNGLKTYNYFNSSPETYTVEDILFNVSIDGKMVPVIKLQEFTGRLFTMRDLVITDIEAVSEQINALCGVFLAGQTMVGLGVNQEQGGDTSGDDGSGESCSDCFEGVALIDENGNVIKNRYIKIANTTTEDPNTDPDDVTEIEINIVGNILD